MTSYFGPCLKAFVVVSILALWVSPSVTADDQFDLEVRIMADAVEDEELVQLAREQPGDVVRRSGKRVAQWVETHKWLVPGDLLENVPRAVVRKGDAAAKLLVLVTDLDVVDSVKSRTLSEVPPEVAVWGIAFTEEGRQQLWNLTEKYRGRRAALIVNGEVRAVPIIHDPTPTLVVPALESELPEDWDKIAQRQRTARPPHRAPLLLWILASAGALLGILALLLLLATRSRGVNQS